MMLPELFLIVGATVCFDVGLPRIVKFAPHPMIPPEVSYEQKCFQPLRFSTSQATSEGETAYRVVPATATVLDLEKDYTKIHWIASKGSKAYEIGQFIFSVDFCRYMGFHTWNLEKQNGDTWTVECDFKTAKERFKSNSGYIRIYCQYCNKKIK